MRREVDFKRGLITIFIIIVCENIHNENINKVKSYIYRYMSAAGPGSVSMALCALRAISISVA